MIWTAWVYFAIFWVRSRMSSPQDQLNIPERHQPTETSQQNQNEDVAPNERKESAIKAPKLKASETELMKIKNMITETHGHELWVAVKTGIAVAAATSMTQR